MNEVKKIIEQSLKDLYLNDSILINRYTKEESINHWLAIYIDKYVKNKFPKEDYDIDVEYNRNVTTNIFDGNRQGNNKKIIKWTGNNFSWKEIIPDIIVHKRGSNDKNYFCIEAKKKYKNIKSAKSANKDLQTIIGLLSEPYNFKYGCLIEYLPEEEYFNFTIVRRTINEYVSEEFYVQKPKL